MRLTPRYDESAVVRIDVPLEDPATPLVRQRRRLGSILAGLTPEEWSTESRCDEWTVKDVIAHLVGTNQFWALSITSGLAGSPTRFLESFDPVATPAAMVDATRASEPAEILEQYVTSVDQLAAAASSIGQDQWSTLAEAPPGHVDLRSVALHALWDAWIHERDILLPLGREQTLEDDEVRGCVIYAAAISPALTVSDERQARLGVTVVEPAVDFVVDVGNAVVVRERRAGEEADLELTGNAVDLVEGFTLRTPMDRDLPDAHAWLLGGLAQAFDRS